MLLKMTHKSNTWYALADQGIVSGANFLTNLLLARWMGIESFGIFWMIWMQVLLGNAVQSAVVIAPMQNLLGYKNTRRNVRQSTAAWLMTAVVVAVGSLVFFAGGRYLQPGLGQVSVLLVTANVLAYNWVDYLRRLFFITKLPQRALLLDGWSYGLQLILVIVVGWKNALSPNNALIVMLLSNMLPGGYFLYKHIRIPAFSTWINAASTYFQAGKWLLGAALLQWFSGNWFLVLAGSMLSAGAAGAIRMVQQVLGLTHILFLALENIIPAGAAGIFRQHGETALWQYFWQKTEQTGALVLPFLLVLGCFSEAFMQLIYGPQQQIPVDLVRWFTAMYVLVFAGTMLRFVIRALGKTRIIFVSGIVAATFSLLFGQIFISNWGIAGALSGMIISQLITLTLFIYTLVSGHENYTPRIGQSQS